MNRFVHYRKALRATGGQYRLPPLTRASFHKVLTIVAWQLGLVKPPKPPKEKL